MSDDFPQKCVFRCEKKEFFEALKKEQDFIGNNLYKYLDENSHELFEKFKVDKSRYINYAEDNSELRIIEANGQIKAEISYIYSNTPAPEAAYCLAETIARKAGIDITEVHVYIYFWWVSYQFVITNDPQMKNRVLVGFTGDETEDNKIIFGESKLKNITDYESTFSMFDPQTFNEPSELLAKIKAIIKDENLQGYENLGKDYIFDDTDHDEWCCISDWYDWNDNPPNEEVLAILDFTERYNRQEESKQNQNGEPLKITPIFFTYSESIPTENPAIQSLLNLPANSAAEHNFALEQIDLAKKYYKGEDIEEDKAKAEDMFKQYGIDGDLMYKIGHFYSVQDNFEKAIEWYSKALENGDCYSLTELGELYYLGKGCKQDKKKAEELFTEYGTDGPSMFDIGYFYSKHDNFEKAFEWYSKAVENGSPRSINELGKLYYQGKGCRQDKEKAEELFTKYGTLDNNMYDNNMYDIACFYSEHADFEKAFKWFKRDFEEIGEAKSAFGLAKLYYQGKGCKQDKEKAKILFDQVFDSSWFQEYYYMAHEALDRYDFSDSNEDLEEALYYFEEFFAEANEYFNQKEEVTNAAYYLALHYYEGDGCKQDKKKAFYYSKFVEENYTDKEDFASTYLDNFTIREKSVNKIKKNQKNTLIMMLIFTMNYMNQMICIMMIRIM